MPADPSVSSAGELEIIVRGFYTSEDEPALGTLIHEIDRILLSLVPDHLRPAQPPYLDSLLIILHADSRVEVWLNEATFIAEARVKRAVEQGQSMHEDDVSDIETVRPVGIDIPPDAAFIAFFSIASRNALVFDFRPLLPRWNPVGHDAAGLLAAAYTYVAFRARTAISDADWDALLSQAWFPFTCLDATTIAAMVSAARSGSAVDDHLPAIVANVRRLLPDIRSFFSASTVFARHRDAVLQAVEAYERGHHALAAHALYTRAEGVLRDLYASVHTNVPGAAALARFAGERPSRNPLSLLVPPRFARYLAQVIFANESFANPAQVSRVTRHSVAHGVADSTLLDEKAATVGLLCLHQVGLLAPA